MLAGSFQWLRACFLEDKKFRKLPSKKAEAEFYEYAFGPLFVNNVFAFGGIHRLIDALKSGNETK
jgi:hypothetical protein